jgi:hypothetical protein
MGDELSTRPRGLPKAALSFGVTDLVSPLTGELDSYALLVRPSISRQGLDMGGHAAGNGRFASSRVVSMTSNVGPTESLRPDFSLRARPCCLE